MISKRPTNNFGNLSLSPQRADPNRAFGSAFLRQNFLFLQRLCFSVRRQCVLLEHTSARFYGFFPSSHLTEGFRKQGKERWKPWIIRVDPRNLAQSRCVGARMVQLEGEFPSEPRSGDTSSKMHRSRGERQGIATGNKKKKMKEF